MKRVILACALFVGLTLNQSFGQVNSGAPNLISYQSVILNNGQVVASQQVGMRISLIQGSATGTAIYVETHTKTTNNNGLLSLEIGGGTVVSGNFSTVDWSQGPYFIKTEIDPAGGTSYTMNSVSQLLSVPYSFYSQNAGSAKTADSLKGGEDDPNFANSPSAGISNTDIENWNKKVDSSVAVQNLENVLDVDNSAGNNRITDLADPVSDQDAVNKRYVEEVTELRISPNKDTLYVGNQFVLLKTPSGSNSNTVTDPDGNVYPTVTIGTQVWMTENLRTTKYANGDAIPNVTNNLQWSGLTTGAWIHYNNSSQYDSVHGKLYNWYTAVDSRNVCPTGWHVPSESDWNQLIAHFDPNMNPTIKGSQSATAGGKLKHTAVWNTPNVGATNSSGFTAVPGGYRNTDGTFNALLDYVSYWSTGIDSGSSSPVFRNLHRSSADAFRNAGHARHGLSIRCVKD